MSSEIKCVFCNSQKDQKCTLFSEETLKRCEIILHQRKFHNLKYKDVILPTEIYDSGYHTKCYSAFTALKQKYHDVGSTNTKEAQSKSQCIAFSADLLSIQEPSTSSDCFTIADTLMEDPPLDNVNLSVTDEVIEIDNNTQLNASLEEKKNMGNICFFCGKKKIKSSGQI